MTRLFLYNNIVIVCVTEKVTILAVHIMVLEVVFAFYVAEVLFKYYKPLLNMKLKVFSFNWLVIFRRKGSPELILISVAEPH